MMKAEEQQRLEEVEGGEEVPEMSELMELVLPRIRSTLGLSRRRFLGATALGGGAIALNFAVPGGLPAGEKVETSETVDDRSWVKGYFDKTVEEGQAIVKREPFSDNRRFGVEKQWYAAEVKKDYGRIFPSDIQPKSTWGPGGKKCKQTNVQFILFQPGAMVDGKPTSLKGAQWNLIGFHPEGLDPRAYSTNKDCICHSSSVDPQLDAAEKWVESQFGGGTGYTLAAN